MKYLLFLSILVVALSSCDSPSKEQTSTETVEQEKTTETPKPKKEKPPYADIDVVQFKKRMSYPDVYMIDVRTPEETAQGTIEGAMEFDINDSSFEAKLADLDKDNIYLVYCQSGIRSATACNKMANLGFKKLYNLEGGYNAWSEAQE